MDRARDATGHKIGTPLGAPSAPLYRGRVAEPQVYFLRRHACGRRLLPRQRDCRSTIWPLQVPPSSSLSLVPAVWNVEEEPVSAQRVFGHLVANADTAKKVLLEIIPRIPKEPDWPEHSALDSALTTERKLWPEGTIQKLKPILGRFA